MGQLVSANLRDRMEHILGEAEEAYTQARRSVEVCRRVTAELQTQRKELATLIERIRLHKKLLQKAERGD